MNSELTRQVKLLAADPPRAPILRDLLMGEAASVIEAMKAPDFDAAVPYSKDELARRVGLAERIVEGLARAVALVGYWGSSGDDRILPAIIARLANSLTRTGGTSSWLDLDLYPAVLTLYAAGLGCVLGNRDEQLGGLLASRTVRERSEWKPVVLVLSAQAAVDYRIAQQLPGLERHHTPMSDHLFEVLRPWLDDLETDAEWFEQAFNRFEYLHGLVMFDLTRQAGGQGFAPIGRYSWRGQDGNAIDGVVRAEIIDAGPAWPLLRAGLFGGDVGRLADSLKGWNDLIARARGQQL